MHNMRCLAAFMLSRVRHHNYTVSLWLPIFVNLFYYYDNQHNNGISSIMTQTVDCNMFSKWHKWSQSTGQAETVTGSSLAPHIFLIVPLTGSTGPAVHLHGSTESAKSHLWKQNWLSTAVCSLCLDSARV